MALNEAQVTQAADLLAETFQARTTIDGLPETCSPANAAEAVQVQVAMLERLGLEASGYKAGFTNPPMLEKAGTELCAWGALEKAGAELCAWDALEKGSIFGPGMKKVRGEARSRVFGDGGKGEVGRGEVREDWGEGGMRRRNRNPTHEGNYYSVCLWARRSGSTKTRCSRSSITCRRYVVVRESGRGCIRS